MGVKQPKTQASARSWALRSRMRSAYMVPREGKLVSKWEPPINPSATVMGTGTSVG